MSREEEFTKRTRVEAFERAKGRCEGCGCFLKPGAHHYDHATPLALGGTSELSNCRVLCIPCHSVKTSRTDIPRIAKTNRIRAKQAGIRKPSRFPGARTSRWKKKINGEVVLR